MSVSTILPTGQPPTISRAASVWRSLAGMVGVSGLLLVTLVIVFVRTRTGARYDHEMEWALGGPPWLFQNIEARLQQVSVARVGLACVVLAVIGLCRRRIDLAAGALVLVGGATITTQVLKNDLIYRLPGAIVRFAPSMPSGHATVGVSVSLAALLVLPAGWQRWSLPVGAAVGFFFGAGTVIGHWHHPSDVLAAIAVCLGWSALALATVVLMRTRRRIPRGQVSVMTRAATVWRTAVGIAFVSLLFLAWGAQPSVRDLRSLVLGLAAILPIAVGMAVLYTWVARTAARIES